MLQIESVVYQCVAPLMLKKSNWSVLNGTENYKLFFFFNIYSCMYFFLFFFQLMGIPFLNSDYGLFTTWRCAINHHHGKS